MSGSDGAGAAGKSAPSSRRVADVLLPAGLVALITGVWQLASPLLPSFILPSPAAIAGAFVSQFSLMAGHAVSTVGAAALGLAIAVLGALVFALLMDSSPLLYRLLYPLSVLSQTVPLIAVAPLFILWFGFGPLPKILAVILVCFFPILVNLLKSFQVLDSEYIELMKSMGASRLEIYRHVKIPGTLPSFFAGLRIAATYSIMGAVIGEWLGGSEGLGVYLIRSQKSFAASRVFAAILMIVLLSMTFFLMVKIGEYIFLPWLRRGQRQNS
jgi:ABC-type nitrate/sulfonate/bicarbonate transport system permease component